MLQFEEPCPPHQGAWSGPDLSEVFRFLLKSEIQNDLAHLSLGEVFPSLV